MTSLMLMQSCQSVDAPKSLATGICVKNGEIQAECKLMMYNKWSCWYFVKQPEWFCWVWWQK